jgi:hypothetical protein
MSVVDCNTPVSDADIADYWAGGLAAESLERFEDHVFSCSACARRAGEGEALAGAVRALVRGGRFDAVVTDAVLNRLARDGVRVRSYSLDPGVTVACAVFPDDELVVTRLRADMSGVDAVDVVMTLGGGDEVNRMSAVPIQPGRGEVLYVLSAAALQQRPSSTVRLTMTTAGEASRTIGEYVLEHTFTGDLPRRSSDSTWKRSDPF